MLNGCIINIDQILVMFLFLPPHTPAVGTLREEELSEVCRSDGGLGRLGLQEVLAGVMRLSCLTVHLTAHSTPYWLPD